MIASQRSRRALPRRTCATTSPWPPAWPRQRAIGHLGVRRPSAQRVPIPRC